MKMRSVAASRCPSNASGNRSGWGKVTAQYQWRTTIGEEVVLVHPVHPLRGRPLEVMGPRRWLGRACLVVRTPTGEQICVPVDWTNRRPWPPTLRVGDRCARLHPAALMPLLRLVTELRSRHASGEKLALRSEGAKLEAGDGRRAHVPCAVAGQPGEATSAFGQPRPPRRRGNSKSTRTGGR